MESVALIYIGGGQSYEKSFFDMMIELYLFYNPLFPNSLFLLYDGRIKDGKEYRVEESPEIDLKKSNRRGVKEMGRKRC